MYITMQKGVRCIINISRRGLEGSSQSVYWSARKKCFKVFKFSCKAKGKLNKVEMMKF